MRLFLFVICIVVLASCCPAKKSCCQKVEVKEKHCTKSDTSSHK